MPTGGHHVHNEHSLFSEKSRFVRIPVEFEVEIDVETEAEVGAVFEPYEPQTGNLTINNN
jgi:hypothetical protein